ncbi:hypothetical protein C8R44DRAFT_785433 [Mycena epipterygia]|nr:hypothetical protein C8R44DRAFT_785433 [Mycena epipterygia]
MRGAWQTLRDRLAEVDAQISVLEAERKIIRRKMRKISYPVLELPPEIKSEIFLHCLPNLPSNPSPLKAPLLFLGICRGWREIALQTPALWASFRVSDRSSTLAFGGGEGGKRLSDWLRRTGSAPLDLKIRYHGRSPSPTPETSPDTRLPDMLVQLFDRAPQWRDVDLGIPFHNLVQLWVTSALTGKLDTLEKLSLRVWHSGSWSGFLVTVFSGAPNLREVSLTDVRFANIILPWAQLTSLTVTGGFSVKDCVQVLQLSPRLTSCQIGNITGELDNLVLFPPLPNLKSLLLNCYISVHILRVLTLPGLTTLRIPWQDEQYVKQFLLRASPARLCKLLLPESFDFLPEILPLMPALADIEIKNLYPDEVADFLQILRESPIAATHLQSITIHVKDIRDEANALLDYHMLVATLIALKVHALQSFRLTWHRNENDEDRSGCSEEEVGVRPDWTVFEQLSELVEDEGMHIYLGTTKHSWM